MKGSKKERKWKRKKGKKGKLRKKEEELITRKVYNFLVQTA